MKTKAIILLTIAALWSLNCGGSTFEQLIAEYESGDTPAAAETPGGDSGTPEDFVELQAVFPVDNTTVKLVFDEAVTKSTAENTANYSINNSLVVLSASRDTSNTAIVNLTVSAQTKGTTYTITVSSLVGSDGSTLSTSLNTGTFVGIEPADAIAPTVLSATATGSTTVEVSFSEPIDESTLGTLTYFTFSPTTGIGTNPTAITRDPVDFSLIRLTTATQTNTIYTVSVSSSVKDLAGNGVGSPNSAAFNGNAGDTSAPTVSGAALVAPDDDSSAADPTSSPYASVEVTFSEDVDTTSATTSGNYAFTDCSGGLSLNSPTTPVLLMSGTKKVAISLDAVGFTASTTCKVTVTNVQDLAGNTIIAGTNTATFTYDTSDSTAPTVTGAAPSTTSGNTTVRVTFSEPMGTGVTTAGNYSFTGGITASAASQVGSTNSYDVTVSSMSATSYTVTVTGVQDANSNSIDTSNNTATFTGDSLPSVSSVVLVSNTKIRIVFSEVMNSAGSTTDYTVDNGIGNPSVASLLSSPSNNVVELTISSQTGGTSYTVTVGNGSGNVEDTTGNDVDSSANTGTFTGDGEPQVVSASMLSPTSLSVTFDEPVGTGQAEVDTHYSIGSCDNGTMSVSAANQTSATTVSLTVSASSVNNNDNCTLAILKPASCTAPACVADLNGNTLGTNTAVFQYTTGDSTAPTVAGAVSTSNTNVRITFSEAMGAGVTTAGNYSIPGLTVSNAALASGNAYDLTTSSQVLSSYTVTVSTGVQDLNTNPIVSGSGDSATFTGTQPPDTTPPTVLSSAVVDNNTVDVFFSEDVDLTTAQASANYSIDNSLSVISAVRQSDASQVRLTVSSQTEGTTYTITVKTSSCDGVGCVKDLSSNAITASNTIAFTGVADTSPPAVLAIYQYDCNSNGNMDEVVIEFNGPVLNSSIASTDALRFTLDGISFVNVDANADSTNGIASGSRICSSTVDPWSAADDAYLTLFTDDTSIAGTNLHAVTYATSSNRIEDATGNDLATFAFTAAAGEMKDKAPPAILSASGKTGTTSLRVTFSEAAYTNSAGTGNITEADLTYGEVVVDDVSAISSSNDDASDKAADLTANGTWLTGSTDFFMDTVAAAASAIYDNAGNASVTTKSVTIGKIVSPFVLTISQTSNTNLRLKYSEEMQSTPALNINNYCLTTSATAPSDANIDGACGGTEINITAASQVDGSTYDLTAASTPGSGTTYYLYADTAASLDLNDNTTLVSPTFASFVGAEAPTVLSAQSSGLKNILVTFSKPMTSGTSCNGVENIANYSVGCPTGSLTVTAATQQSDTAKVLLTHSESQGVGFCSVIVNNGSNSVNGSCTGGSNGVTDSIFGKTLDSSPKDRFSFEAAGGQIDSIDDGSLFTDPFADGTSFAFAFTYAGKIYLGPNESNSGVFRFDPDVKNAVTTTFVNPGSGNGITSFGANMTRPTTSVTATGGNIQYNFPDGTDLSAYASGNSIEITSCTNANNNRTTTLNGTSNTAGSKYLQIADGGTTGVTSSSETCSIFTYTGDGANDSWSGVNAFTSGTDGGTEFLLFGGAKFQGLQHLYFTADQDNVLNNIECDINGMTLGNTKSLQVMYSDTNRVYLGFASDAAQRPLMGYVDLTTSGCTATDLGKTSFRNLDYLGQSGAEGNSAANVGIDSIVRFSGRLYIANNGGIAFTTADPPTSEANFESNDASGDIVQCDAIGSGNCDAAFAGGGTTQEIPSIGKIRPGERGVPFMIEYQSNLYVARNRSDSGGSGELYKVSAAHAWSGPILKSGDTVSNGTVSSNSRDISMIAVNGSKLYIGFDNDTEGAEIFYTSSASPTSASDFTKLADSGLGPSDANGGSSTERAKNKHVISFAPVNFSGKDYLYITIGCQSDFSDGGSCDRDATTGTVDFSIKVFRQVD